MMGVRHERGSIPGVIWRLSEPADLHVVTRVVHQLPLKVGIGRCGITYLGRQAALVTLGYPEVAIGLQELRVPGMVGRAEPGASASPTETPQARDTAAGPHTNPTDETAHSGTLVMRVKGTQNSWSAAPMLVSWAVGAFSS
jgi:hypothetical protein